MRGTATPLKHGPFSVALPGSAGVLTIPSQGGSSLSDNLLPWLVNVDVLMTPITHVNFGDLVVPASGLYNGFRYNAAETQNDEISFDVVLAVGTWTFEIIYIKDARSAIYTVQLGGATIGTIDAYANLAEYNTRTQITGISVTSSAKIRLRLLMATKNASSGAYRGLLQHIQFKRTA